MESLDFHNKYVQELRDLFYTIEKKFLRIETADFDSWYLVTLAAITGGIPEDAAHLYNYLIEKPGYQGSESRKEIMRRLRECLFKLVGLMGIVKPLVALFSIEKVTREKDKDYSFSKQDWQPGTENTQRGEEWLQKLYSVNLAPIWKSFNAHKDFEWLEKDIIYGLFLSDHSILNPVETELLTLTGIMMQNMPQQTYWHLRGTRRIGVSKENVETIQQCIEMIAKFHGVNLDRNPRVADVEHEIIQS